MAIHFFYMGIIITLLLIIGVLIDIINKEEKKNEKYYKQLRSEFNARLEELKDDLELQELIYGGMYG